MDKKQAFSQIYDEYIDKIYRFVFLKVNSRETAEDIASETFLRGWKTFQDPGLEIENISAFLFQIARNLVIDFYRKKGKIKIVALENVTLSIPDNSSREMTNLNTEMTGIRKALCNLKDDYQDVIIWHYLDELSISEIARILDKSEGTIRTTLHRALKALRARMSNE